MNPRPFLTLAFFILFLAALAALHFALLFLQDTPIPPGPSRAFYVEEPATTTIDLMRLRPYEIFLNEECAPSLAKDRIIISCPTESRTEGEPLKI